MIKKFMILAAVAATLTATSCKSDDDNNEPEQTCRTCGLDVLGTVINSEYCDNGDGTITITTDGESQTQDLNGVSFTQFISALEQAGATCN